MSKPSIANLEERIARIEAYIDQREGIGDHPYESGWVKYRKGQTDHNQNCRWEKTTLEECEYRVTHHYCPHPEHDCTCKV